jgi:hypothetical protein
MEKATKVAVKKVEPAQGEEEKIIVHFGNSIIVYRNVRNTMERVEILQGNLMIKSKQKIFSSMIKADTAVWTLLKITRELITKQENCWLDDTDKMVSIMQNNMNTIFKKTPAIKKISNIITKEVN